jgi:hypothetical protein
MLEGEKEKSQSMYAIKRNIISILHMSISFSLLGICMPIPSLSEEGNKGTTKSSKSLGFPEFQ